MIKIAILGFGNIGSGVLQVLRTNSASVARRAGDTVGVGYILDVRDFSSHPDARLFVNNIDVILEDKTVSTVVETIGGVDPAYYYVKSALLAGKNVCTSNKELVATHGAELLAIAREKKVCFLFEASVGGGIPLLAPIRDNLCANVVDQVHGIVNGTTNFMLTRMEKDDMTFAQALSEAQRLGYAETRDPSADVDGIDAQRKISILASLLFGSEVHPADVPARGIRQVGVEDIWFARKMGAAVKLIAYAKRDEKGKIACGVEPMVLPLCNQLANVQDVYNAVMLHGDMLGDVMFYGAGAGKLPTASAVVSDIVDCAKYGTAVHDTLFWQPSVSQGPIIDSGSYTYYVRVANQDVTTLEKDLGGVGMLLRHRTQIAVLTYPMTAKQLEKAILRLEKDGIHVAMSMKLLGKREMIAE